MIFFYGGKSAQTGPDQDSYPFGVALVNLQMGIFHRHDTGGECIMDERIHLPCLLPVKEGGGIKILYLTGNLGLIFGSIKSGYRANS
jgi:hypothetical protein